MARIVTKACEECGSQYQIPSNWASHSKYCGARCRNEGRLRLWREVARQRALERFARAKHHATYYEIELSNNGTYLVDDEDIEAVKYCTWNLNSEGYIVRTRNTTERKESGGAQIRMHRLIMERKLGRPLRSNEWVDHKKGNPRDNRRSMLRLCSTHQNAYNSCKPGVKATSRYKGVTWHKGVGKWMVQIRHAGCRYYIAHFDTELEAAYVYDQWAVQLHGRFSNLNVL